MKKVLLSFTLISALLYSCTSTEESKAETKEESKIENCYYAYNPSTSKLDWTAFKFLRKAPVGGTFTIISVNGPTKSGDAMELIKNLSFTIPVNTVETNNPDRNKKVDSLFFGSLANTNEITGKVVDLKDDGNAILEITMNGISKEVTGTYTLENADFNFKTTIDVLDWSAQAGLTALNTACKDLHTDTENGDTESKLWSVVDIVFSTTLKKDCE